MWVFFSLISQELRDLLVDSGDAAMVNNFRNYNENHHQV
jgi:hypothetical protein